MATRGSVHLISAEGWGVEEWVRWAPKVGIPLVKEQKDLLPDGRGWIKNVWIAIH